MHRSAKRDVEWREKINEEVKKNRTFNWR
jgi:hypothetical protein